ncbi:MAG: NADH:ubiquinone oxidoreductase, partial [Proteobacteria bacterium]|nr:NADH:ubiquinone oxidoreductase [Pseudomonadota bacterium]
ECTAKGNTCLFELGEPCLGPITRAGCDSWCPDNRMGCWGCRGPADEANIIQFREVIRKHNIPEEVMLDRMECFGGFRHILKEMKGKQDKGQME